MNVEQEFLDWYLEEYDRFPDSFDYEDCLIKKYFIAGWVRFQEKLERSFREKNYEVSNSS